jgi:hypothetical protein
MSKAEKQEKPVASPHNDFQKRPLEEVAQPIDSEAMHQTDELISVISVYPTQTDTGYQIPDARLQIPDVGRGDFRLPDKGTVNGPVPAFKAYNQ